ncbi:uncharacterized protein Triagg1_10869 [Trichoderma aggressivum f. europaeum]|uniref:Uncharacterized protein n=1 Tax=Trichoderma aggressivum f. europaeum TaxID=173218 RepID=A0AAE1I8B8_9HYPO|nr:hypothetical protein Triagg1_10869 [Trichoderma aggressivum f. europaeum]
MIQHLSGRAPPGSFKASLLPLWWTPVWADRRSDEEAADTIRRETVAELGRSCLAGSLGSAGPKHNRHKKESTRMKDGMGMDGLKPRKWQRQRERERGRREREEAKMALFTVHDLTGADPTSPSPSTSTSTSTSTSNGATPRAAALGGLDNLKNLISELCH